MINNELQKITKLNEYQKKKIKRNLSCDFFYELDSLTFNKEFFFKNFSKIVEIFSTILDSQGTIFYGINLELEIINDNNKFEEVYKEVEEFLNYIGYKIELVEFCYISIELKNRNPIWQDHVFNAKDSNENEKFLIKGLIAVRSILGENKLHFMQIKELFLISYYDINVVLLNDFTAIKLYWLDLIKQKNFKFHRFVNYSNFFSEFYGLVADEELKFDDCCAFGQENHFISDTMNITGIKKKNPSDSEVILYLLCLFMDLHKLVLYKNNIYKKIISSKISWCMVSNLEQIKKRFIINFNELQLSYPQHLKYFNINDIILGDLDFVFSKIEKNNILLNKENIFDSVIEFKDGLYFLENKKFLSFDIVDNLFELKTNIYIDCIYSDVNKNSFWLILLKNKLSEFFFKNFFSGSNKENIEI